MKCPQCRKNFLESDMIGHLRYHGYTKEEAERMLERIEEFGDY
jgi:hypothetical protein